MLLNVGRLFLIINIMNKIRTFIAIELPDDLKKDVDKLIVGLKQFGPDVRWVKAGNLHFTLRFLGDIDKDDVPKLSEHLNTHVSKFAPFRLRLTGLGCFPNMKRPRIVWLGADGDMEMLKQLAFQVESVCRDLGYSKADKPFSAHLTIGRINDPRGLEPLINRLEALEYSTEDFTVEQVIVFKSDLSPRGPTYTSLAKIKLQAK